DGAGGNSPRPPSGGAPADRGRKVRCPWGHAAFPTREWLSLPLPGARAHGIAALVEVDVVEHRHDRLALEPPLPDPVGEPRRHPVAEAALHHEGIPQFAVLIRPAPAALLGPGQKLLVGILPCQCALPQFIIVDPQEAAAAAVEAL